MHRIDRVSLFNKLNPTLYRSLESATAFAKLRGHAYVELGHWLHQILKLPDSDLHRILTDFDVQVGRTVADILAALDRLPRGASAINDLSDHIDLAVERAWAYASLSFGDGAIRSGVLLYALLTTPGLRRELVDFCPRFDAISVERLSDRFGSLTASGPEAPGEETEFGRSLVSGYDDPSPIGRYSIDLTAKARLGEIDPVTGRDAEIRQIVDVLLRRRQNNPLLAGEAGVGKTAVVEGLALRIASGDVPPPLREVTLRALDVGLLQAGASMRGEFEERLRALVDDVLAAARPVILFIDEVHTLIGAGGAAGTNDAANLLKPLLARGTLRTIGATTWGEYKKYIERDPALTRRFQVVRIFEPDEEQSVRMVRSVAKILQRHHGVILLDEAVDAAVRLSHRYLPERQLPDKAVSLLDTACARVATSQHSTPAALEDCLGSIDAMVLERELLEREAAFGLLSGERIAELDRAVAIERGRASDLNARYRHAKDLFGELQAVRGQLTSTRAEPVGAVEEGGRQGTVAAPVAAAAEMQAGADALRCRLRTLDEELAAVQGEWQLVLPAVNGQAVASVVAEWTGIPVGRMLKDEAAGILGLADTLEKRVIGQREGLETIARRVQTARAKLDDPAKPVGVFLLCGPSGVGKTETALALAESLYGGEQNLITINMSEFQEPHTVSTLKGAPPGYVGYGEGGVLTEAVRRRPYSVVLLDEVEKAHPDVHEIFYQVFDKGWMEDGEGRHIDFRNTIIILTSNVGSGVVLDCCRSPQYAATPVGLARALREPLLDVFPPALLGRLVVVPYLPLSDATLAEIIALQLGRIRERIGLRHGARLEFGADLVELIARRCTEIESGGRMVDSILTNTILPEISRKFLERMVEARPLAKVRLSAVNGDISYEFE